MVDRAGWDFEQGDEIVPGRLALDSLGGGKQYEAWLAWDSRLFALVVAKIIRPDQVDDDRTRRQLQAEAEVLGGLAHPVILRSFDAVVDGPRPHLVLEHLDGPNLRSLLRRFGPVPLEQLLPLALQICSALHYLAQSNTVHLDVKPRNIIMGSTPRLIDFSVARSLEKAGATTGWIGTPRYMAPEQCDPESRGPIDLPADVWGLGVTLYEAMTGVRPFPQPDDDTQFPQLDSAPAPLPKHIPAGLSDVVLSCLVPEPRDRPVAAEVALALEPFVAGLPGVKMTRRGGKFVFD